MKLIKLSDTHYIVVNNSEIRKGDWCFRNEVIEQCSSKMHSFALWGKNAKKITHSTEVIDGDGTGSCFIFIKQLSLSEVEEAINGYSWKTEFNKANLKYGSEQHSFYLGFKAHEKIVKDKLFNFKQVNDLVNSVLEFMSHNEPSEFDKWYQRKLQKLLPKTEWDIKFDEQDKIKLS